MDSGVAGLPGQSVLMLVEITASPAPAPEHAQRGGQGQTARERALELRNAVMSHAQVKTLNFIIIKCSVQHFVTVDGDWGEWTEWGACSIPKCGGQQTRKRSCDNPAPAHGGCDCTGTGHGTQGVMLLCIL